MIKSLNKTKSQDLSNFYLVAIVCGAIIISLVTLVAIDCLPVGFRQPGSPLLQSAAIIGSILLILSFLAILAKRFGKPGRSGFKAHVWLANIGFILIIAHSGLAVLSIPGILLILLLVIAILGIYARLVLSRQMENTFGTKRTGFSAPDETMRNELKHLIAHKQRLLKKIDPSANEAFFSIQARNWVKTPVLAFRYNHAVGKEAGLLETRKSVPFFQAYYRSIHQLLSIAFLLGLIIHIVTTIFFAGYVAEDRHIYWWHITEWGS